MSWKPSCSGWTMLLYMAHVTELFPILSMNWMEEKRVNRLVTVPAVLLEKVMVMAGSEIYRLHAVGSENGGDGDAFVREERGDYAGDASGAGRGERVMNISTETREILRNYKTVINARRREMGQKPLTTAQIVDEICDFVANQQAVFLGGHYILQGSRNR